MNTSRVSRLLVALLVFVLGCPVTAAQARNVIDRSSEYSFYASLASFALISGPPLFLSGKLAEASRSSDPGKNPQCKQQPCRAEPLPDMEVKEISDTEDGDRQVILAVPDTPEYTVTLAWVPPADHHDVHDPTTAFTVGQMISFQPSPQASGWLLQDATGTALAFVPVPDLAEGTHTALF